MKMESQPTTLGVAGTLIATRDNGNPTKPSDDGVQGAAPSTSGSAAVKHQQQDDHLLIAIPLASVKQFRQLFGATCQVKLQRCVVPVPDANNAVVIPSGEVSSDSCPVTVAKVEEETTGSGSSSEDDQVQVLPAPLAKKKRMVTKKKRGKGNSHQKSPVHCPVCKMRLRSKKCLKVHMLKHSGEKRYRCEHCGRSFWSPSTFAKHKKARSQQNGVCPGEKRNCGEWRPKGPWTCKICGKRMKTGGGYVGHMRSHRGEKPAKCGDCGKAFGTNGDLSEHKRIHSGVWPYVCAFCEKGFHQQSNLFNHLRVHTEEKPYFCVVDGCGMCFRHSDSLKRHRRLIHLKKY